MPDVIIKCEGSRRVPVEKLRPFQGNLKDLSRKNYTKLRGLIDTMGFSFPIFIWVDSDNNHWILDGHQRVRTLLRMKKEGYNVPNIPVADVSADSYEQAKKKLMAAVSGFGQVTSAGLYEFLNENKWELDYLSESFSIPNIDMEEFKAEFYDEKPPKDDVPYDDPDIEMSDEIDPRDNYLLITFEENQDFIDCCRAIGLEKQKQNLSGTHNEKFLKYGHGRVISHDKFFERIKAFMDANETDCGMEAQGGSRN